MAGPAPGGSQGFCVSGGIEDKAAPTPAEAAGASLRHRDIKKALSTLSEREAQIIRLRVGVSTDRLNNGTETEGQTQ